MSRKTGAPRRSVNAFSAVRRRARPRPARARCPPGRGSAASSTSRPMSCRRVAPTTRQQPDLAPPLHHGGEHRVRDRERRDHDSATRPPPSITPRRNASARSSCASASAGRHDREARAPARGCAAATLLGILAVLPEDGRGGGDRQDLGARDHGETPQHRLAVEEQPLGRGERHHHEAVGAGERRLEDADDVERRARGPRMVEPTSRVEALRHLAADHDLVAPGLRARGGPLGRAAAGARRLRASSSSSTPKTSGASVKGRRRARRRAGT